MQLTKMKNMSPATVWQDSTPTGNGKITALVYGNVYAEKILINHERWWFKESSPELPDFKDCLARCRRLMDEGNYIQAERVFPDEMAKYTPMAAAALFQPGIDVRIESQMQGEYSKYSRMLDMSTAEVTVSYVDGQKIERKVFASRKDGVIVVKIKGERLWSGRVWLEPHELENAVGIFGEQFKHGLTFKSFWDEGVIHLYGERNPVEYDEETAFAIIGNEDKERRFGALMRVYTDGGKVDSIPYSESDLNVMMPPNVNAMKDGIIAQITDAKEIVLLICPYEGECEYKEQKSRISNIMCDYDALFEGHKNIHSGIFNKTSVDFATPTDRSNEQLILSAKENGADSELLNKMWYYGRYLFVISTGEGCLPAHLSGKWNGDYFAPWRGVFFIDENTEIIYWQAYAGNMPELLIPLFDLFDSKMDDFKENARKMFGCRGIRIPIYVDPFSGHEKDYSPHALYWVGGAPWIATMYWDYYDYTGDEKFLVERAYPFMKQTMLFFEDYLVKKGDVYTCYPSTSPENCANGIFEGAGKINACIDATMDISLIKCVAEKLIFVSEKLNIDIEEREKWKDILAHLPQYKVNEDGAFAEWLHPDFKDNYKHRHLSHLFPVFPGDEIGMEHPLMGAAEKALEKRMSEGLKEMTGWALAHTANVYANLNNAGGVWRCLKLIARHFTGKNLFGYHNNDELMGVGVYIRWCNHAPHQLDVSSGFTSAVLQSLCYKKGDVVEILPAIENGITELSANGILLRGGLIIDQIVLSGNKLNIKMTSTKEQTVTLKYPLKRRFSAVDGVEIPSGKEMRITLAKGRQTEIAIEFEQNI